MDFLSFDEKQINHLLKIMKVTLLLIWISIFSLNAKEGLSLIHIYILRYVCGATRLRILA